MSRVYIAEGYFQIPLDELVSFLRKYTTRHFHWYQDGDEIQFGPPEINEDNQVVIAFAINTKNGGDE